MQNRLGIAYAERRRGKLGDNVEKAIAAYSPALEVLSPEKSPIGWAMAQNNLGAACSKRAQGDRAEWGVEIGSESSTQTRQQRGSDK